MRTKRAQVGNHTHLPTHTHAHTPNIIASAFINPIIADCGIIFTKLHKKGAHTTSITPINRIDIIRCSTRSSRVKSLKGPVSEVMLPITTAIAPAAPEIMAGLPPKSPVKVPTQKTLAMPACGGKPAMKAKAIDSGTSMRAKVMPERISFRKTAGCFL